MQALERERRHQGLMTLLPAARAVGLHDLDAPLRWLAWRDDRLACYEPPRSRFPLPGSNTPPKIVSCHALVVCGSAMAAVPLDAADLFVDVLHPAGCRTVVLSGGVGRGTLALWRELVEKDLASRFASGWAVDTQPPRVILEAQGRKEKAVLAATDDVPQELFERRHFCSEADIMLELFVSRCRQRGVDVQFGGDPLVDAVDSHASQAEQERKGAFVYLETASTNSGANCALSAQTLSLVGVDVEKGEIALVQHPQAHMRTCLTWEKQRGKRPIGWCSRPSEDVENVSTSEMLLYGLGELRRIEAYAEPCKGFLLMPPDFPREIIKPLATLEPLLRQLVQEDLLAGLATAYATSLGISLEGDAGTGKVGRG